MSVTTEGQGPLPALATHEDVAKWTEKTYDAAEQARLTLALAGASRSIRNAAGWHVFPVREDVLTVDGSGAHVQLLPTGRLLEVLEVHSDATPVNVPGIEWSADGYLRVPGRWSGRLRGVTARVRHGYDDVPDLHLLTMQLALRGLQATKYPGLSQLATGPFSAKWDAPPLMPDELATIAPYRIGG